MADDANRASGLGLMAWAGVTGAAGVALAAVAAHRIESPALATAAMMLILHAAAAVAIVSASAGSGLGTAGRWVAGVMLAAVALFSGDVTVHAMTGSHIFPYAAPTGGSTLIASWLGFAVVCMFARLRR